MMSSDWPSFTWKFFMIWFHKIKGNAKFVQKVTFEPLTDFKQNRYGNITEAATFKSFLHLSYKNTQLLFLWQRFLIFNETNISRWYLEVTQKYELRVSFKLIFQKQPTYLRNICTKHWRKLSNLTAFFEIFLFLRTTILQNMCKKVLLIGPINIYFQGKIKFSRCIWLIWLPRIFIFI